MATVFFSGALLAAFIATNVLGQEIENRTALTVISKPVGRPLFVLGKFFGVAGALVMAIFFLSLVFLLVELHAVIQTVRDPIHLPVLVFGISAGIIGLVAAVWCNYFYNKVFASSVICFTTPLLALAYLFSLMFDSNFVPQAIGTSFKGQLWLGLTSVMVAILILTAIAIAASTRLGQVMTLAVTIGVFLMGLLSDWFIGRRIATIESNWLDRANAQGLTETVDLERQFNMIGGEVQTITESVQVPLPDTELADMAAGSETMILNFWEFCYAIIPNFQVLWMSDAITQEHIIPGSYMVKSSLYGLVYIVFILSAAVILFQRREVG